MEHLEERLLPFCTVMSPLCRRDRSGNLFLHSKCRSLDLWLQPNLSSIYFLLLVWEEAAKQWQWPWAMTWLPRQPCLCGGVPAQTCQLVLGHSSTMAEDKELPNMSGSVLRFSPAYPLQDHRAAPSKGNVWFPNLVLAGMQITSSFMCVWGGEGWLYNFNDCRKIFIC